VYSDLLTYLLTTHWFYRVVMIRAVKRHTRCHVVTIVRLDHQ